MDKIEEGVSLCRSVPAFLLNLEILLQNRQPFDSLSDLWDGLK